MIRVKIRIKFNESFLNRFPPTILHGDILNIYTVYETTSNYSDINYPTLENCLFRSVKLAKNDDIDKYGYSGLFRFVRQIFISALLHFSNLPSLNPLECILMKNQ